MKNKVERRILEIILNDSNKTSYIIHKYFKEYPDADKLEIRGAIWNLVKYGIIVYDSGYFKFNVTIND